MSEERPDLHATLEHFGVLGRKRVISCPLHGDRNPSCSINFDKGLWRCHSCGKGGDSYTLIEEVRGIGFAEAKEYAIKNGLMGEGGATSEAQGSRYAGKRATATGRAYRPSWRAS